MKAVFFDVGETLLDETRAWMGWADWLGVSALTMLGLVGATIARGEHHLRAFEFVRPGFDLEAERRARAAAGSRTFCAATTSTPTRRPASTRCASVATWSG